MVAIGALVAAATIGRVGRDAVPALDTLPPWAGGRPDVAICEGFIRDGLAAPSTYRRVAETRIDGEPGTLAQFDKAAGIRPPKLPRRGSGDAIVDESDRLEALKAELEHDRASDHAVALRIVSIDYDEQNAAGVPIRAKQSCGFRLVDGEMEDVEMIRNRVQRQSSAASPDTVRSAVGLRAASKGAAHFDCCL